MQKRTTIQCLIAAFLMMIAAGGAHGFSLGEADVKNFVSSMWDIKEMADEFEQLDGFEDESDLYKDEDPGEGLQIPENPISDSVRALQGHAIYDRLQTLVRQHGFSGVDQWSDVGDRVLKAFVSAQYADEKPEITAEIREALREIDESPHMSESQKEMMKQQIQQHLESVEAQLDAPEKDMEAVRPHMEELREVFEYDPPAG